MNECLQVCMKATDFLIMFFIGYGLFLGIGLIIGIIANKHKTNKKTEDLNENGNK